MSDNKLLGVKIPLMVLERSQHNSWPLSFSRTYPAFEERGLSKFDAVWPKHIEPRRTAAKENAERVPRFFSAMDNSKK